MPRPFRPHQQAAFAYTLRQRHPALFMEMRLGKTLVAIRRCLLYKPLNPMLGLRVLVVAPGSALQSWKDELQAEGQDEPAALTGERSLRLALLMYANANWFLINREGFLSLPEIAIKAIRNWDAVILDESFIRNPRAKVTKFFLSNFRDCPHRWMLSGTPNHENDMEFWPQLAWLDGQAFGYRTFWDWRAKEWQPDLQGYNWYPLPSTTKTIRDTLAKRVYALRRTDAGAEPTKETIIRILEFPPEIRIAYDTAEKDFVLSNTETTYAIVKYNWLRQLCGGFDATKPLKVWDGKLRELLDLITGELRGIPTVVWFHYNQELLAALNLLIASKIGCAFLYGKQSLAEREGQRQSFQQGKVNVLLVQQAVAQMGMNLDHADTAIYYSQTPSAIATQQTADRMLSLNKKTTLLYIYLLVKDSIDEDLHEALKLKKWSSNLSLVHAIKEAARARQA